MRNTQFLLSFGIEILFLGELFRKISIAYVYIHMRNGTTGELQ